MTQQAPHDLTVERAILGRMLLVPDSIADIAPMAVGSDFYHPLYGEMFRVLVDAWQTGEAMDSVSFAASHPTMIEPRDLAQIVADAPAGHQRLVERLVELRLRRGLIGIAEEIRTAATDGGDPFDIRDRAAAAIDRLESPYHPVDDLWTVEDFIARPELASDWIIPGLFREQWRAILVAAEGIGKTVLSRQIAAAAAAGMHPLFPSQDIEPIRTLVIDLENPSQVITKSMRQLRAAIGDRWRPGSAMVWHRPGGLNLRTRADRSQLETVIAQCRPRFVALGPLYKAYSVSARESDEQAAAEVQHVLDDLRTRYGFALLLEHHAPKAANNNRPMAPYGSSFWLRWPELGLSLMRASDSNGNQSRTRLTIGRWRLDRVENGWPQRLDRGTKWPWLGEWDNPSQILGEPEEMF